MVAYAGREKSRNMWRCRCNRCGKEVILRQDVILADVIKSCGCYRHRDPKEDPRGNESENLIGPVVLYSPKGEQLRGKLYVDRLVFHQETVTPEELEAQHITPSTIRLSIGTEHIADLLEDLRQALEKLRSC